MGQLTTDNIVTIADETIPLSEINDSDLILFADSEGNFKKSTIEELINKTRKANVPLETPYVQLPNMPTPDTLYLGTWEDVSAQYNGAYLRVLGTDSGEFGTLQAEGLPNITGSFYSKAWGGSVGVGAFYGLQSGGGSHDTASTGFEKWGFDASLSNSIYGNNTHVTPKAHAIKIWKRTA